MSVMTSVMRGARRLVLADLPLFRNFLTPPLRLRFVRSSAPLLTCPLNRKFASKGFKDEQVRTSTRRVNVPQWVLLQVVQTSTPVRLKLEQPQKSKLVCLVQVHLD